MFSHAGFHLLSLLRIALLAIVQGAAELLPVSSSAHVIIVEKLLGLDPTTPEMTLLLVMLHTGTMLAVILYFWKTWRATYFSSWPAFWQSARLIIMASILTAIVGLALKLLIERFVLRGTPHAQIELLFGNTALIGISLATVGILILYSGWRQRHASGSEPLGRRAAAWMGAIQGLCLPFRGFSRSGATISAGLLAKASKARVEAFSFALAVVLTPPIVLREAVRLVRSHQLGSLHAGPSLGLFLPALVGMLFSFIAGLLALKWLSRWLESGRWYIFGGYCLFAAGVVLLLYLRGY